MNKYIPIWSAALLVLAACVIPSTPQDIAGITSVTIEVCEQEASEELYLCKLEWIDGKIKEAVSITLEYDDLSFTYSANGVILPEQVMLARAQVHEVLLRAQGRVSESTVDAVMGALMSLRAGPVKAQ